jgi:hypothetical protein
MNQTRIKKGLLWVLVCIIGSALMGGIAFKSYARNDSAGAEAALEQY